MTQGCYRDKVKGSRGFTLVELLVVMVLIGLIVSLASILVIRGIKNRGPYKFQMDFKHLLARARMRAIVTREETFLVVDPDNRKIWIDGTKDTLTIPKDISLESERITWGNGEKFQFPFFPDGSCPGGTFVIKWEKKEWKVAVNPALGFVE